MCTDLFSLVSTYHSAGDSCIFPSKLLKLACRGDENTSKHQPEFAAFKKMIWRKVLKEHPIVSYFYLVDFTLNNFGAISQCTTSDQQKKHPINSVDEKFW